jgi:hypothetical protein
VTLEISRAEYNIDVTPGTLTATDTCIGYHKTRFEASRKVILHARYVSAFVGAGGRRGRGTKIKTKVILHTRYESTRVGAGGGRGRGTKIKVNVYLPSLRMKVPDHVYVLGHSYTCHTLIKYNR